MRWRALLKQFLVGLVGVGAGLPFGILGVVAAFYLVLATFDNHGDSLGAGMAIGFLLLVCCGVGAVLGLGVGIFWMSALAKRPRLLAPVACLSAIGWVGTPILVMWFFGYGPLMEYQKANRPAVVNPIEKENDQLYALFKQASRTTWPGLLGPLKYPGAQACVSDASIKPDFPRIVLLTHDDFAKVAGYYEHQLTDIERANGWRGRGVRPGDGKPVTVGLQKTDGGVLITILVEPANLSPTSSAVPATSFPEDPAWPAAATIPDLARLFGELVYPNSHTNVQTTDQPRADAPYGLVELATADSLERVRAYYRSRTTASADTADLYQGLTQRSGDGLRVIVGVKRMGDLTYITLSSARVPDNEGNPSP